MKKKPDDKVFKAIKALMDKKLAEASRIRDELRSLHSNLEDILEDWDTGCDDIEGGMRLVEHGIATLSRQV